MESLCWRGESRVVPPDIPRSALPLRASLFHVTHDLYDYDLMTLLKNICTGQWVGPRKSASNRVTHLRRPALCVRIVWICLGVEFVRSTQGWKVSFWWSEENSVWILKWTTLLGIFYKMSFTPAVTSYYLVRALNADARLSAALLCYFRCHWCQNLAAVNCILHWIIFTLSTLQMGITLVIVVA